MRPVSLDISFFRVVVAYVTTQFVLLVKIKLTNVYNNVKKIVECVMQIIFAVHAKMGIILMKIMFVYNVIKVFVQLVFKILVIVLISANFNVKLVLQVTSVSLAMMDISKRMVIA